MGKMGSGIQAPFPLENEVCGNKPPSSVVILSKSVHGSPGRPVFSIEQAIESLIGGSMKRDLDSILLTRQELQIMRVVWETEQVTVREVCEVISRKKPTAYTTVLTLMGILEEKGALAHVRSGRAYVYRPLLSRRQATQNQVRDVIARFFDGQPVKLVESVLENEVKERDELKNIKCLLEARHEHQLA